jgi:hypothetical protein
MPSPAMVVSIIALILAVSGTAVAASSLKGNLKLAFFEPTSRDRLAGTGVIEYATQSHKTGALSDTKPQDFAVTCGGAKKATSGGFNWIGDPPPPDSYKFLAAYPFGGASGSPGGYKVRIYILKAEAVDKEIHVFANCVKSRKQLGTPPAA